MGSAQGCMTKEKVVTTNGHHVESAHLASPNTNETTNQGFASSELAIENDTQSDGVSPDEVETLGHSQGETQSHEELIHVSRGAHIIDRADTGFSEDLNVVETTEDMSLNSPACQVAIQKPAPFFRGQAVVSGQFKEISLEDYKGKYVVLFFYPLDFTFVCPTEIIAFSDRVEDFRNIGCELIACSTDSHYSHFAWVSTTRKNGGLGEMNIPLLSDKTGEISRKYGVYKEDEGIAYRGLFIIDEKQNLRQITINDLPVGRSVDETLRLVQAFQFTDKHGEVCPAGWKPGAKTIKPSVEESKAYFKNV